MISKTPFSVSPELLSQAIDSLALTDFRLTLNKPTGEFFYDPWEIKDEFKNTVWDTILKTIPGNIGEARLIKLEPSESYYSHADIDDRWHLNLTGNQSYLIDLDNQIMHPLTPDGYWYYMNASRIHTASNYGQIPRVQLVVRNLLKRSTDTDTVKVTIIPAYEQYDYRYTFDRIISPWLNLACKELIINNFAYKDTTVTFDLSRQHLEEFKTIVTDNFTVT